MFSDTETPWQFPQLTWETKLDSHVVMEALASSQVSLRRWKTLISADRSHTPFTFRVEPEELSRGNWCWTKDWEMAQAAEGLLESILLNF